jgi:hypothetical protein
MKLFIETKKYVRIKKDMRIKKFIRNDINSFKQLHRSIQAEVQMILEV